MQPNKISLVSLVAGEIMWLTSSRRRDGGSSGPIPTPQ